MKQMLSLITTLSLFISLSATAAPDAGLVELLKEQIQSYTQTRTSDNLKDPVEVWIRTIATISVGETFFIVGGKLEIKPEVEIGLSQK